MRKINLSGLNLFSVGFILKAEIQLCGCFTWFGCNNFQYRGQHQGCLNDHRGATKGVYATSIAIGLTTSESTM